jgi:hypothetical protein
LGYVLATIFTTVALDVTGIAAATMLFTASFFILPYKRKRAIEEFKAKVEKLRSEMRTVFESKSADEINRATENVRGALEPYTRFVKSERAKVEERSLTLRSLIERLQFLKREIKTVVAS